MSISIRSLKDTDLQAADSLLKLAFQSSVSRFHDLQFYRRIQPDGWFVASQEDQLVGTVGATCYGIFAHIGLMAVHPDAQHQGIGAKLMQFLLAELERRQIPNVWLDASESGRPLYAKLGFVPCRETFVFQRGHGNPVVSKPASCIEVVSTRQLDELARWDQDVFGTDRRKVFQVLLDMFPKRAFIQRGENGQLVGYVFVQSNRIGPWVMLQPRGAEELLQAVLGLPYDEDTLSVTVPAECQDAMNLLQRYEFEIVRTNRHMGKGMGTPPGQRERIYSQTSLAIG